LFHGAESHQRADLFDEVAETALDSLVDYQKATGDNHSFLQLLQQALLFASGSHLRERLIKNISIGKSNVAFETLEPVFTKLSNIEKSALQPWQKWAEIKSGILPKLPSLASSIGQTNEVYQQFMDSLAIVLRGIAIDAYNKFQDLATSDAAIQLALKLAVDPNLKTKINGDITTLERHKLVQQIVNARHVKNTGCLNLIIWFCAAPIVWAVWQVLA
jgi:hypothetical protein